MSVNVDMCVSVSLCQLQGIWDGRGLGQSMMYVACVHCVCCQGLLCGSQGDD